MDIHKIILKFVSISFSILVTLLVIIGLIRLGEYCYHFGYRVFTEPAVAEEPGTDVVVLITDNMSEYEIGEELREKGLILDQNLFFVQLKLSAYSGELRSGTYTLNTSMTAKDMMTVMAAETVDSTEETEDADSETAGSTQETEDAGSETADGTEETEGADSEKADSTQETEDAGAEP